MEHLKLLLPETVRNRFSNTSFAKIPVRSRQQAMDWSLALISQGIESTIDNSGVDGGWVLLITPTEMERALKTLRQYRMENRAWTWPKPMDWPSARFNWNCLAWAAAIILFYWLSSRNLHWAACGILDSVKVSHGQWWRLITAMTLHADLGHLAENLGFGIILMGLVMGRFGAGTALLAAGLAGIAGNLVSFALNLKPFHGLGASGMVMGALGLLAVASIKSPSPIPYTGQKSKKFLLGGVAAGIMLLVLYGLNPASDVFAHTGGFAGGLILGILLVFAPRELIQNRCFNVANGALTILLLSLSWWLAFQWRF